VLCRNAIVLYVLDPEIKMLRIQFLSAEFTCHSNSAPVLLQKRNLLCTTTVYHTC
jgi:hypothetical protein